ncbi:MAG: RNA-binding protein [candidate division Zixibacteria bacterium CG_4_9_14_3_um_filter_46_8]|nr:MAG: RNA-binding protein [candidate division Zixibacteria bacterium CG_4_9_14_3_um_filter_46_8]
MKLYVGNLSPKTTEDSLRQMFQGHGEVSTANIVTDRYTGESRGFGFVEMSTLSEAQSAITSLNGRELDGSLLKVNEARPRDDSRGGNRGGSSSGRRY